MLQAFIAGRIGAHIDTNTTAMGRITHTATTDLVTMDPGMECIGPATGRTAHGSGRDTVTNMDMGIGHLTAIAISNPTMEMATGTGRTSDVPVGLKVRSLRLRVS